MIFLLILALLVGAAVFVVNKCLDKIGRADDTIIVPPEDQFSGIDATALDVEWGEQESIDDEGLINIMLVGQDSRDDSRERSDAMILCSINPETGEIAVISFLRDLYVQMPDGYMDNRMNAAYKFGGFPFLYEVMEKNFGISCDGGIEVNFDGFVDIVDAVGGVDIELTGEEAEILGVDAGMNHLNGEQALTYSRIRKLDSDFGRTDRQRTVLDAILNKVRSLGVTELFGLMSTFMENVTTDMTNSEILAVAGIIVPVISSLELNSYRIPTDDAYYPATVNDMAVLVPDLELCRKYLKEDFLPFD